MSKEERQARRRAAVAKIRHFVRHRVGRALRAPDEEDIEAAQALARIVLVTESNDAARLETGFVRTAGRHPSPQEVSTLADLLAKGRARFASAPSEAVAFASDPLGPLPTGLAPSEAAAWTLVAQVLLTMEEAVVR